MALVVITGGTRSGKSAAAERLADRRSLDGTDVVVAVFARRSEDVEMADRIERHRTRRPGHFTTIEAAENVEGWFDRVPADALLVVDCLGTLLGLHMERVWADAVAGADMNEASNRLPDGYEEALRISFSAVVERIVDRPGDTVVVTNEVGAGVVSEWVSARVFTDALGRANRRLVGCADSAWLCVCGRLIDLASLPADVSWPED